jgi:high-affinity iron transporter
VLESLIIAVREGIEVALVLGILVVYVRRIHRPALIPTVYSGLGAAILASVVAAIVLQRLAVDHELLEGFFMIAAAVFVATMVIWMWVTAKGIRREIEQKVDEIILKPTSWQIHAALFAFTFLMVIREGIETAIFLQAVAMSTEAWSSFIGALLGFAIAMTFAVLFIQGSLKIDIARFLKVTAVALLVFVVQLMANGFHEFYEFGILPANPRMMGILGPIVRNDVLFVIAIVCIPALMLVIPPTKKTYDAPSRNRRLQLSVGLVALSIIFFLGVGNVFSSHHEVDLSALPVEIPEDGVIRIPIENVDDGNLHRYTIDDDGLQIRFFVLRTGLGKFATAFDACYACYNFGRYYMRDGELICSQCDAPSSMMRLKPSAEDEKVDEDMSGSMEGNRCSPIYLASVMKEGSIQIKVKDLQAQRKYFDTSAE